MLNTNCCNHCSNHERVVVVMRETDLTKVTCVGSSQSQNMNSCCKFISTHTFTYAFQVPVATASRQYFFQTILSLRQQHGTNLHIKIFGYLPLPWTQGVFVYQSYYVDNSVINRYQSGSITLSYILCCMCVHVHSLVPFQYSY